MKFKNLNYKQCVERGRDIVENMKNLKYDLCELVLRVCEIKIGGHGGNTKVYSMKHFAKDIGMKENTLRKWVEEHRNVSKKLGFIPKKEDYVIIRKVLNDVTSKTSSKKVKSLYKKYKLMSTEDKELLVKIKYAKNIRNFVQDYSLTSLDQDQVYILTEIIKDTLKELTQSKKICYYKTNKRSQNELN